jgi:hypothetical protein
MSVDTARTSARATPEGAARGQGQETGKTKGGGVFDIDREHPEYKLRKQVLRQYRDLYAGGEQLRLNAQHYLVRRQREPGDVYAERLSRVFYENYIGSIVDWYAATLFNSDPVLTFEGKNETAKQFYAELVADADRKGTKLSDFWARQLVEAMVAGASYVLVDFPRTAALVGGRKAGSRGEEDAMGASRAYLVDYSAEDVINWSFDEQGNYNWVVIRTRLLTQDRVEDAECRTEVRWAYYDRQNFRIYKQTGDGGEAGAFGAGVGALGTAALDIGGSQLGAGATQLVAEGTHGLAKLNQVPLFPLRISEGLWMLNRAGLLQLEHFNKSNALAWALTMGLFAMPVVYSERDWGQMVGESYYIQLGPGDRFGWTEPEGKVYQIAADNLKALQEEIYRVCYQPQAGGSLDRTAVQSGISKQIDFSITQEVLCAYGDAVKDQIRRVLSAIEAAREDGITISVAGLDEFDISDFSTELSDAQQLLGLGIDSPTLKREIFKKLSLKYLSDTRQEIKDRIVEEIDGE